MKQIEIGSSLWTAMEWIRTDPASCREDVKRLGLDEAAEYNIRLIEDRHAAGDKRWDSITIPAMREALQSMTA